MRSSTTYSLKSIVCKWITVTLVVLMGLFAFSGAAIPPQSSSQVQATWVFRGERRIINGIPYDSGAHDLKNSFVPKAVSGVKILSLLYSRQTATRLNLFGESYFSPGLFTINKTVPQSGKDELAALV